MFDWLYISPKMLDDAEAKGRQVAGAVLRDQGLAYGAFREVARNLNDPKEWERRTTPYAKAFHRGMVLEVGAMWPRMRGQQGRAHIAPPALPPRELPLLNRLIAHFFPDKSREATELAHVELQAYNKVLAELFDPSGFVRSAWEAWDYDLSYVLETPQYMDEAMQAYWRGVSRCLDDTEHRLQPPVVEGVATGITTRIDTPVLARAHSGDPLGKTGSAPTETVERRMRIRPRSKK